MSDAAPATPLDAAVARDLLSRWDAQQERYIARREQRFEIIVEAVRLTAGEAPRVIDLACGPGSLGRRLLARIPDARIWAVDADPLLQSIGSSAGGGLIWVERDLRRPGWSDFLDGTQVDAVVSTTALHWLAPADLIRVYEELARIIRPGGLFLDGDHRVWPAASPALGRLAAGLTEAFLARNQGGAEAWETWWQAVSALPALEDAFRRREIVYADRSPEYPMSTAFHIAALQDAGFAEAGTLWQIATDWVVAAVR